MKILEHKENAFNVIEENAETKLYSFLFRILNMLKQYKEISFHYYLNSKIITLEL